MKITSKNYILGASTLLLSSCYLCTAEKVQDYNRSGEAVYLPKDGKPHVYRKGDAFYLRGTSTRVERSGLAMVSFYDTIDKRSGTYTTIPGAEEKTVFRKLGINDYFWDKKTGKFFLRYAWYNQGEWDDWQPDLPKGASPLNATIDMQFYEPPGGTYMLTGALEADGSAPMAPVLAFPLKWLVDVPATVVATTVYGVGSAIAMPVFILSQQMQQAPPPPSPQQSPAEHS